MSELTPKISVIVPVYKAEAYLHRCVDSLLAQTFQDYEILLIDDGSPDRSGEICDEYARKDKRIRVFHKENGGVSSARQCGIDNARGEYTIHADPDDWVEPEMLEELYGKAKSEDADMVICDYYYDERDKTVYISQKPSTLDHETVLYEMFQRLHGSSWNKLVRLHCFQQFSVKYPVELSYCEDLYVNACLLSHEIKVAYLPKAFYHYDQYTNPVSLVHRSMEKILYQERILYTLLRNDMPCNYFQDIASIILSAQVYISLHLGGIYLQPFSNDYKKLEPHIKELDISFKYKLLYWIAFKMSPKISHTMLQCYSQFKKRIK